MITFRQHVVTIVAVFLALAVGVVLGGGPLSEVGRGDSSSAQPAEIEENADVIAFGNRFAVSGAPRLYDDGLAGRPVALVTLPGADDGTVRGLVGQVEHAGGTLTGTYTVQEGMVDAGDKSLGDTLGSQLVTQLGSASADVSAPTYERMGQLLGSGLATTEASGSALTEDAGSIRESLAGAELLTSPEGEAKLAPLVLVVLGTDTDDDILSGLVGGLTSKAKGVVVAGSTDSGATGDVAALRAQPLAADASTVDGVEHAVGQVSAVLTLIRSLSKPGGSYGASGSGGAAPLG